MRKSGKGWTRKKVQLKGYRKEDLIGLDMYSEWEKKGGRKKCISGNRKGNENGEIEKILARRNCNGDEE
jgi:hypothetical protein